ncbi:MAG TPA: hypothetical protein VGS19_18460 [Streptosporangiaceae bacterium]|nr:hypothetical protein [Streptosporangiaceae bacterium]
MTAGQCPDQHARTWLFEVPTVRLLGPVVPTAQWRQVALAGPPAPLAGKGVVNVTAAGRAAAAGEGAGGVADLDEVP